MQSIESSNNIIGGIGHLAKFFKELAIMISFILILFLFVTIFLRPVGFLLSGIAPTLVIVQKTVIATAYKLSYCTPLTKKTCLAVLPANICQLTLFFTQLLWRKKTKIFKTLNHLLNGGSRCLKLFTRHSNRIVIQVRVLCAQLHLLPISRSFRNVVGVICHCLRNNLTTTISLPH